MLTEGSDENHVLGVSVRLSSTWAERKTGKERNREACREYRHLCFSTFLHVFVFVEIFGQDVPFY